MVGSAFKFVWPRSSKELLTVAAVREAEPVRRLLRLGEAPTGIFAAAVMLANMMLHIRRRGVFRLGQSDFIAHSRSGKSPLKNRVFGGP